MSWAYRIIDWGDHLALHEVHFDEAGKPKYWSNDMATFAAHPEFGAEDLIGGLRLALSSVESAPILKASDYGWRRGA